MENTDDINELPAMRYSQREGHQSPPLLPLTRAQRRILFGEQSWPGTPFANLGFIVRFERTIDPVVLEAAIHGLLKRHDGLRLQLDSATHGNKTKTMQYVAGFQSETIEQRDFSAPDTPEKLAQWAEAQTRIPFILHDAPLYNFALLKLPEGKWGYYLKLHHIIADGWTLGLLVDEIRTEILAGISPASPPSYCEYISDELSYLSSPAYEADRTFWANKLASVPNSSDLHLPTKKRSGIRSHRRHICFPAKLRQQVHKYCQTEATTIFRVCLGALYVFMARRLDRYDVTLATATHGRTTPRLQQMTGMFVGTVPMRIRVPEESTFRELLATLREDLREILAHHQRYPYEDMIRDLRNAGVDPGALASVFIVGHKERYPEDMRVMNLANGHEPTAMVLHVFSDDNFGGGEIDLIMDCQADLFSLEEMASMQRALLAILDEATRSPDLLNADVDPPIAVLSLISPEDRKKLLIDWNATHAPLPESCVHQIFEAQVKATPQATAVVFEDESLTYDQLNTRANQLAHHLLGLGVEAEALVAIALERSPTMIVALLAVLKAGGAYVPLDPEYPADRLAYMLEDCGARILLTQKRLRDQLPQTDQHTLCLDSDWTAIAGQPESNPDRPTTPKQLAYVIYTSGSTGKPKGVMIEQRGLVNFMLSMQQSPGFSQQDSLLAVTTISFDIFGLEIYLPLISGGKIVLVKAGDAADPAAINNLLLHNSITVMQATPATWRMLVDTGWSGKVDLKMLVGGEALLGALAKKLLPLGNSLWNLYGPTETTIWSSLFPVANENADQTVIPIGHPITNTQLYILNRHNQPTPIGVPGELHIGGAGLARGYLNRPELTAEKFIPDPFSDWPDARLYKTGDRVCYRPDGNIEFLGRIDHQVKIRGFRIELGEIEAALAEHPDIREAVVVARTEESGDKRLVAYLVADASPDPTKLRSFLKLSLPDYMLPTAFVFLDALPLTPNGKVDRKALPEPEGRLENEGYHLPRDSFEQHLIEIWESVLSVRPIGINHNFFDIGGHSLLAVRLITEMNKKFRKHLPISRLFEFPTIAGIASLLRKGGDMPAASCLVKIRQRGSLSPLFVLPGASGMTSYLYPFAHYLDEDIPFFAFQAQGLEGEQLPHTDFAEMVTHYVERLLEVQPIGPYFLAGHSFGALVAFAMAQRLLAQGQSIGMLTILDTHAPLGPVAIENSWLGGNVPLVVLIGQFLCLIFDREITFSKESVEGLNDQEQLNFVAQQLAEENLLPADDITDHLRGLLTVFKSQLIMQNEYLPDSYIPLPITLFRSSELMMYLSEPETYSEDMGWGQYSSRPVPIHYVPGNHVTMMMMPHVEKLAELMTSEMRGLAK
jgi:amino acid adenylation domain-containing protein